MSALLSALLAILAVLVLVMALTALALAFVELAARQYRRARSAVLIAALESLLARTPARR